MPSATTCVCITERYRKMVGESVLNVFWWIFDHRFLLECWQEVGEMSTPPFWYLFNQSALTVDKTVEVLYKDRGLQTTTKCCRDAGGKGGVKYANDIQFDLDWCLGRGDFIKMVTHLQENKS